MDFDVVIIGGGAAGLSGAVALARARRSVLVLDDGVPRNAPADAVHNYLGHDGVAPAALLTAGRTEVARYGGVVRSGRAVEVRGTSGRFTVRTDDGGEVQARRLLLATGLVDELPDVAGLAQRWGRDVLHCPYCHGWEVRDQPIAVLATGPMALHQVQLFRQWSSQVTLALHTAPDPTPEQCEELAARGIEVVHGEVAAVEVVDDVLTGLRLTSGRVVPCRAVVVAPRYTARVPDGLGLEAVDLEMGGHVVGSAVPADANGATAVPGVWVAGNVEDLRAQVVTSAAAGLGAATMINADLVEDDVRRAVADRRSAACTAAAERELCGSAAGERRRGR